MKKLFSDEQIISILREAEAGIVLPPGGFFDAVDTRVAYHTVLLSHIMTPTPDAVPGLRYHADWT